MSRTMTRYAIAAATIALLLAVPAHGASINKSIKIGAGEESGGATSINGSITVGSDATVTGGIKTVNGKIRVDDGADIEKAATVNGSLHLGEISGLNTSLTVFASAVGPMVFSFGNDWFGTYHAAAWACIAGLAALLIAAISIRQTH